jgi:nucleoside-diphosphate-sugar epimerase
MRVLVVGAGFLGKEIVMESIRLGIPSLGTKRVLPESSDIPLIALDVFDHGSLENIPGDTTHIVYSVSASEGTEEGYRKAYIDGQRSLFSYLKERGLLAYLQKYVFISSTGVYSEDDGSILDEDSPSGGEGFRSRILREAEGVALEFLVPEKVLTLRFSGIYGPERTYLISQALGMSDENLPVDDTWTNRIHKLDGARACMFLVKEHAGVYIVTDTMPVPRMEVIQYIRSLYGRDLLRVRDDLQVSGGKQLSSKKLVEAGFVFRYPTYREGYRSYVDSGTV